MEDQIPVFSICPRCGEKAYDRLSTHAYCAECNYSPDFDEGPAVPEWAIRYARETKSSFEKAMKERGKPGRHPVVRSKRQARGTDSKRRSCKRPCKV